MNNTPRAYLVHFSRGCPRGLAPVNRRRPIKGTVQVYERSEDEARGAAKYILDAFCVIDRVERLPARDDPGQPMATADQNLPIGTTAQ